VNDTELGDSFGLKAILGGGLVVVAACSACVPIQQTRDTQIESYHQRYSFCKHEDAEEAIDAIFGSANKRRLKNAAVGWEYYIKVAENHHLEIVGQATFSLSLNPADRRQFYVEGFGRHVMFDKCSGELVASISFDIVDDGPHWVSELSDGELTVWLKQKTVREFRQDRPRFVHTTDVFVKIYVAEIDSMIFSIDYQREHVVGISIPRNAETYGDRIAITPVGYMQFDGRRDGRAIIDLREIDAVWLKDDYETKLRQKGLLPLKSRPKIDWLEAPKCPLLRKPNCPDLSEEERKIRKGE
jgi:hypothetical protein